MKQMPASLLLPLNPDNNPITTQENIPDNELEFQEYFNNASTNGTKLKVLVAVETTNKPHQM